MRFRFLKLTTAYPEFTRDFTGLVGNHEKHSYGELKGKLEAQHWGLSSDYSKYFRRSGHEADEIYASMELLQKAWARERNMQCESKEWKRAVVLEQIRAYQPDIIFLHDLSFFVRDFRRAIREAVPASTLIVGWRFAEVDDFAEFRDLDLMLTGNGYFVECFRKADVNVELLPLSFDTDQLQHVPACERDLPVTFVGSIGDRAHLHAERYRLLERILAETPLQIWGRTVQTKRLPALRRFRWNLIYQANMALKKMGIDRPTRRKIPVIKRGAEWGINPTEPPLWERYPGRVHPPVFGLEHMKLLARTRVALNSHSGIAGNSCGNMRMFEATGMGACLLTDHKADIGTYFEADREIVTYRSTEEAIEKTRTLLENHRLREEIAAAGQKRTWKDHTLESRARLLEAYLIEALRRKRG